jgi:ABC-type multidrug transport system fused ATPase/permease subunit
VAEVLAAGDEVVSPTGAPHLVCAGGRLHLRDVTFAYAEQPVLRGLSLSVEPGGSLAILGRTGAGKSTLAGLIARLYDPQEGSVAIDGQDLLTLDLGSVRSAVAVALQEPVLFPATVAENIGYGRFGATQEEILAAARAACAHEFIERLPQGYDTRLGARGATLSGGERQRIAIARALLKDAPILILDEPTSALDPQTERRLFQSVGRLRKGKTTIVITHRLSAALFADRIAVLDDGKLAEEGTHEDLISRGGIYRRLQALRSGGPAEGAAR